MAPVVQAEQLIALQQQVRTVYVDALVKQYIVDLANATRTHDDVFLGASPRGSLALFRASQARAAIQGRDFVIPDDVKAVFEPVLGHRLIINPSARIRNVGAHDILRQVIMAVAVPGGRPGERVR